MNKEETYKFSFSQVKALIEGEKNRIANFANIAAVLKENHNFFWAGFYLVEGNELVLGPFQGPVACTRISLGKGVCGKAWIEKRIINVPDVHKFPGHIACSEFSKSEIVVPIFNAQQEVTGILDIDSDSFSFFDQVDERYLEKIAGLLIDRYE